MSRRKRSCSARISLFSFQDIITCVMGIMLLLTLLICLQITDTASRSSSEVMTSAAELQTSVSGLRDELADLESRVRGNSEIMQSGGFSNLKLLQEKQREAEAARAAAERELLSLLQQSAGAVESLSSLKTSARTRQELSLQEMTRLIKETKRQQETLSLIQEGKRVVYNQYVGSADTCWIIEVSSDTDFKAAPVGKKQMPVAFSSIDQVLKWIRERHQEGSEFLVLFKPGANRAIDQIPGTLREENILHGYDLLSQDQTALDPLTGAEAR